MTKEEIVAELHLRCNEVLLAGYGSEEQATPINAILREPLTKEILQGDKHLYSKVTAVAGVLWRSALQDIDAKNQVVAVNPNAN